MDVGGILSGILPENALSGSRPLSAHTLRYSSTDAANASLISGTDSPWKVMTSRVPITSPWKMSASSSKATVARYPRYSIMLTAPLPRLA